jgi:GDP-4-dehydro-6-deoxy-D-mannose reductase
VEAGLLPKELRVGHVDDRRNFTHVSDMVAAYWQGMEKLPPGDLFLIGSEDENSIHTFRAALEQLISMSTVPGITYRIDAEFVRPTQVPRLLGDTSRFREITGWQPIVPYERILSDTLDYWRGRVAEGRH